MSRILGYKIIKTEERRLNDHGLDLAYHEPTRHVCVDGQVRPGHRDFCHACYQHAYRGTLAGQMGALRSAVIELGRVMAEAIIPRRWRA